MTTSTNNINQALLADARILRYVTDAPDPAYGKVVMNAPRPLYGDYELGGRFDLVGQTVEAKTDSDVAENLRLDASLVVWTDAAVAVSDGFFEIRAEYGEEAALGLSEGDALQFWAEARRSEGQLVRIVR